MRCEEVREHCADYLGRSLDAGVAREFEAHVGSCAECQLELGDIEALWHALGIIPPASVPSNRMRERFSATVAAARASADGRPASRPDRRRTWAATFWPGEPLVQMSIAASLLVVGILLGRTLPREPVSRLDTAELGEVRGELRNMRQMLTLSLLQQQSATERLRGVNGTAQIEQPGTEVVSALLDTLLHDPNVNVRLAAVDALRRVSDRPDVRLGIKQAVTDTRSPLLQVAVIDFMVETHDPQAASLLRAVMVDPSVDESVRGRAQWGLERLSS